jgi:hypothetical protein
MAGPGSLCCGHCGAVGVDAMNIEELSSKLILPDRLREKSGLVVMFSGGRTSAFMGRLIQLRFSEMNPLFIFANTGQEHPATYDFIRDAQKHWDMPIRWIEAVVYPEKGKRDVREVDYNTACRDKALFDSYVAKFGLPNPQSKCTSELKTEPAAKFMKRQGRKYSKTIKCIGIRADEMDRVSPMMNAHGFWYPLIDLGVTKLMILEWFKEQPFDLQIPEHLGNCVWCWKKSDKKLQAAYRDCPEYFDTPLYLEQRYKDHWYHRNVDRKALYRGKRTCAELIAGFNRFPTMSDFMTDDNGCGESCDAFGTESSPVPVIK